MPRVKSKARRSAHLRPSGVISVCAAGYGFVRTAEGEYFVPASKLGGAFDGDVVELSCLPAQVARSSHAQAAGRPAARVARVLERAHETLIGRYEIAEPFGVVVPLDLGIPYDVFTRRQDCPTVEDGALVRVRIAQYPSRDSAATGYIEEVLAQPEGPGCDIDAVVARHKLASAFSPKVEEEAKGAALDELGALASGYSDLRRRFIFTIDPDEARDFDDALSFEALCDGSGLFRIGIHIADVSHYVPWASCIDVEARRRATSVYLADRVLPMLPDELSGDLCSLAPHTLRRTMTLDLVVDESGGLVDHHLYPALIESKARLTYDQALSLLQSAKATGVDAAMAQALQGPLQGLSRMAKLRHARRAALGGIDFAATEAKVKLDGKGKPIEVLLRRKNEATALVEEMMIWANEVVAADLQEKGFPCAYRIHEAPDAGSLAALVGVLEEFSWFAGIDAGSFAAGDAKAIQAVLAASAGRPEEELVSSLVLRAMKRAVYSPENCGHFGLASGAYAHFTSPIRRYPDLMVHRMLKALLFGRPGHFDQMVSGLAAICAHSSEAERGADEAARESIEVKLAEYLSDYVGQSFSGVVSGVATGGLYVRLDCTAEGFLPVRYLGDEYFSFDAFRYLLEGEDSGKTYRLGQRVAVCLTAVDARVPQISFRLAGRR